MKHALLFVTLFCTSFAYSQVLLDQSTSLATGGIAAQDFETASNIYDCEAADDFTVTAGSYWTIDSILIYGQYSTTATTTSPVRLTLYTDSGGSPNDIYEQIEWTTDQDLNGDGDMMLKFDCPLRLEPQRYWLSARSTKTFGGGGGQWYWTRDSVGGGLHFKWHNVGGGFGTSCSTFQTMTTCVASIQEPGTGFVIYGCEGGPTITSWGADTTVCLSDSLVLTAGNGGLGSPIYNWNTGDSNQTLKIYESGFYNVSVTDPNTNCYSTSCVNVTVNINPTATSLNDDTICQGHTKTYNAFANCGGACIYVWDGDTGSVFYTTDSAGYRVLRIIDGDNGCSSLDSAWLEVESTDPPELTPGLEIDICEGDTEYLATVDAYATYSWSNGESTQGIFITDSGDYAVTVTTPNGCVSNDTASVNIRPAPEPSIATNVTGSWITRLKADAGYQTYLWSIGDDECGITVATSGTYPVTVTDEFGCEGIATIYANVIPSGILEHQSEELHIYPNPTSGNLTIEKNVRTLNESFIEIVDVSGRIVHQEKFSSSMMQLDIKAIPSGYYLLKVKDDEGVITSPILKN